MRARRRASRICLDCDLPGRTYASVQCAPRAGCRGLRRWLGNYQELKQAIEAVCELNHDLLRPERAASKRRRKKQHD